MLIDSLDQFKDIIDHFEVHEYDHAGPHVRFAATIFFVDNSVLHTRQIIIAEKDFKYAYHWQKDTGDLIRRWDNAPHWPDIGTYPHHIHIASGKNEITVTESISAGDLFSVLEEIRSQFRMKRE